jgi:hypothetical protein
VGGFRGRSRRPAATAVPYPLEGLVQDMRDLRLTLAADLNAAAAAAEDGAAEVASDIVSADRDEVARFRRRAEMQMARLQRLAVAEPEAPRWRRRVVFALPVLPLAGAMAVSAAAVTGVLPVPGTHAERPSPSQSSASPVASSFQELEAVVDNHGASAGEVIAAAQALHRQLAALIAGTSGDPAQAAEVAELLRMEQDMLLRTQPPGASVVLDATRRLAAQLVKAATPLPTPSSTSLPKPLPKSSKPASPAPSPKQSAAPKPSPSATADPSSSPNPSRIPSVP